MIRAAYESQTSRQIGGEVAKAASTGKDLWRVPPPPPEFKSDGGTSRGKGRGQAGVRPTSDCVCTNHYFLRGIAHASVAGTMPLHITFKREVISSVCTPQESIR